MPDFLFGIDARLIYAVVVVSSFIVWIANRAAERKRQAALKGRLASSFLAKAGAQSLPGDISILARFGENTAPQQSLDVTILKPTLGVKAIAVVLGGLMIWVIWQRKDSMSGSGFPVVSVGDTVKWAMTMVAAFCVLNTFLFDARIDRTGIVITKFVLWRREFQWRDFKAIKDDGNYLYFLHFTSHGKVSIPKHLVGMPGFLRFLGTVLEQNDLRHAGTARS